MSSEAEANFRLGSLRHNQCNGLVVLAGQTGQFNLLYFSAPPFLMHAHYEVKMTVHLECTVHIINIKSYPPKITAKKMTYKRVSAIINGILFFCWHAVFPNCTLLETFVNTR